MTNYSICCFTGTCICKVYNILYSYLRNLDKQATHRELENNTDLRWASERQKDLAPVTHHERRRMISPKLALVVEENSKRQGA